MTDFRIWLPWTVIRQEFGPSLRSERMASLSMSQTCGYHKTQEISANPKVELCYLDKQHHQVRITGVAHPEGDRELLQQIWDENPLLRNYLGSVDNPDLIVYRIDPLSVRYMREWALEYHDVVWD
jgi:general stress protein 26